MPRQSLREQLEATQTAANQFDALYAIAKGRHQQRVGLARPGAAAVKMPAGLPFPKPEWSEYIGIGELTWKKDRKGERENE